MNPDTYSFFLIVLSGFTLVWSYRHFSGSHKPIGDFEYLGFSSIWGVIVFALYTWLYRNNTAQLATVISNPYVAGVVLSFFGLILGFVVAKFRNFLHKLFVQGLR